VNDQRSNSYYQGERDLKTTDVEFRVNGELIWDDGDSNVYRPDWKLVSAIEDSQDNVLTIRFPDGHIKDDWSAAFSYGRKKDAQPANTFLSESFALFGFNDAVSKVYWHNYDRAVQGNMLINVLLLVGYGLALAFIVYLYKYIKNKAIPASRARATETVERYRQYSHDRKVRSETEALKIKEEAFRRYEAEKIKELIQEALEQDEHERAQELMAQLRETKTD
jgi:hypothetical protein